MQGTLLLCAALAAGVYNVRDFGAVVEADVVETLYRTP